LSSNITKFLLLIFTISLFNGCARRYNNSSYHSYRHIPPQKIKNSKAMQRATMRSYIVHGKRYTPTYAKVGDTFRGIASWYGPNFHAKKTSNGEIYNMYAMTAASKTLPMNTMVKVVNLDNKKSTIVRINDRGPFVEGRIIDLSNKAAHKIDMVKKGTANVQLVILGFNAKIAKTVRERREVASIKDFYLQVGAFSKLKGAKTIKRKFDLILDQDYKAIIKQTYQNGKRINRVWISGFRSRDEVEDFKKENHLTNAIIIAK